MEIERQKEEGGGLDVWEGTEGSQRRKKRLVGWKEGRKQEVEMFGEVKREVKGGRKGV